MLDRLFRRMPLQLTFHQRECVVVPQTPERVALHADVHFLARATAGAATIEDAYLLWFSGARPERSLAFRRSRWDRAVIDGRFRYPPQPLAVAVSSSPVDVTITFNDPLIPHGPNPPPSQSLLLIELHLRQGKPIRQPLWRLRQDTWDKPAQTEWLLDL